MTVPDDAVASPNETSVRSPTVARRMLLAKLNDLVKASGKTDSDLARVMGVNSSTVGRWRDGQKQHMRPADTLMLMTALGYGSDDPLTQQLMRLTADARERGLTQDRRPWMAANRFDLFAGLESGAISVVVVEPLVVPGLLQTAGYAEAIIRATEPQLGDAEIAEGVQFRLRRQTALRRTALPLRFTGILGEAVLRTPLADGAAWRAQLQHLVQAASWPNVTLRVIPFSAGPMVLGQTGPFVVLDFPDDVPAVAYSETPAQAHYEETASGLDRYRAVVDDLTDSALSDGESVAMITEALRAAQSRSD